jgi:superfamily II DNA helicase RecQ
MKQGIRARPFHGLMKKTEKDELMAQWMAGEVECIVATVAFGMVSLANPMSV